MAPLRHRELRLILSAVLLLGLIGCGGPSRDIVGKWRTSQDANAVIWEFDRNGLVLIGSTRGKYTLQDDRVKVETAFGKSLYYVQISHDQMTFRDSAGSQIRFNRIR